MLISVDADDQQSAQACGPFLRRDPRFRMQVQQSRLGWAGNTDWTMRQRRGDFYIFQQHDDQVSPTYVADLVEAAIRSPGAAVCFAKMDWSGDSNFTQFGFSLTGSPVKRALAYLESLDTSPFRGLLRSSSLARTSGLLLSDFDPFDSFGTEIRLLAELAIQGDFRFVPGPTYYKRMHGANLHLKRENWTDRQRIMAWSCLIAWMIEVIVQAGKDSGERRRMFDTVLDRFLVAKANPWGLVSPVTRRLARSRADALYPARVFMDWLKQRKRLATSVAGRWMLSGNWDDPGVRVATLQLVFERLKADGRLDPNSLQATWESLEEETYKRFVRSRGTGKPTLTR